MSDIIERFLVSPDTYALRLMFKRDSTAGVVVQTLGAMTCDGCGTLVRDEARDSPIVEYPHADPKEYKADFVTPSQEAREDAGLRRLVKASMADALPDYDTDEEGYVHCPDCMASCGEVE